MHQLIEFVAGILHISPRVLRFLISGGSAAVTELTLLYVFTDVFGLWYEVSLLIAFIGAFCVSFTLQKLWTFEDTRTEGIHVQASSYLAVSLCNLGVNAVALYIFVQYAHLWYLFAQVIINACIAVSSFFIYKFFIFNPEVRAFFDRSTLFRMIRFVVSGGLAVAVNFITLYLLTEYAGLWYLASSAIGFTLGLVVSFLLQKFWTFGSSRTDVMHVQFLLYTLLFLFNLCLNTGLLYLFVEYAHAWYLFAQIFISACIAGMNYVLYQRYIFSHA